MSCSCVVDVMDVVFSVCIARRGAVGLHIPCLLFSPMFFWQTKSQV